MKIVCIADTHTYYDKVKVPAGDVLIHAGDIDLYNNLDAIRFNKWIAGLPHEHKIVIGGNHDSFLANIGKVMCANYLSDVDYLENSGITIDGIKFWGSPITPRFLDWFFMADRGPEIKKYWDLIPMDTDVLITHGPPMGVLDWVPRTYGEHHIGCADLRDRILQVKPKLHIFGHIHYSYGAHKTADTEYINASCADEEYNMANKPVVRNIKSL